MVDAWITNASTTVEAMVNPIAAACDGGYVPDRLYLLENPEVTDAVDRAIAFATAVIEAYGGDEPAVELTRLDNDRAFDRVRTHVGDAIEAVHDEGGRAAVDITPGRKFMSAIAFAAGIRYEADHVFYFYLHSADYYGLSYAGMPRTAGQLYDFTEEL